MRIYEFIGLTLILFEKILNTPNSHLYDISNDTQQCMEQGPFLSFITVDSRFFAIKWYLTLIVGIRAVQ